ncbi:Imm74 family immunity protein [Massilia sp. TN1-12]|uniref:Imm74 family immunity protein n=1 Tax=Massilia paldalensis TaxID=3377675 RepID=UPI00384D10A4
MELAEIVRGYLRVKDGAKSVTVCGEALLRGYGSPDFMPYQNSIEKWYAPNDQEYVTPAEKEQLIQFLKEEFARRKMFLEIE